MKKTILLTFAFSLLFTAFSWGQNDAEEKDLYDVNTVRELRLSFEQSNWAELMDSIRLYGNGSLLGTATIDGKKFENVGIRYRGSKSFRVGDKRNAFHIKLNYINKNQAYQSYKTIKLSNALRDPSMVREVMSYQIAGQYMPAPKANYAKLYINDNYYGVFINIQAIDDHFLESHYGSSDNTFFKCSPDLLDGPKPIAGCKNKIYASLEFESNAQCYTNNYELKSKDGWDDLIGLTKTLSESPDKIESVLDVDEALWMLAFNNVLVNLSSYSGQHSQNYYLYRDSNGQFHPIVWDLNLSFGSFKNTGAGSDLKLSELQKLDPLLHVENVAKPLVSQLLKNPLYKKVYLSHIRTIIYDHFVDGAYEKEAKRLQRMISNDMFNDPNKFYNHSQFLNSLTKTTGKRSKIPGIVELMSKRAKYLKKHPELSIFPPEAENVSVVAREKFDNSEIKTFCVQAKLKSNAKRVKLYYRFGSDAIYQVMPMSDDGKSNDGKAGDKLYAATVDPMGKHDSIEYFILMENVKAISYDPPNYMNKPYESTISALNK